MPSVRQNTYTRVDSSGSRSLDGLRPHALMYTNPRYGSGERVWVNLNDYEMTSLLRCLQKWAVERGNAHTQEGAA